jgi:hypothetical protein
MQNKVMLEVHNPSGSTDIKYVHAPRLETLNGKTIGEITNGLWQYQRTFPLIREMLQKRFPEVSIVPYTEFPEGVHNIDVGNIGEVVKEKGCDGVIIGNAA